MPVEDPFPESDADKAIRFQNGLIACATGGTMDDASYIELRRHFLSREDTKDRVPGFIRRCSDVAQFWGFIKFEKQRYQERRELIWDSFRPLISYLEASDRNPSDASITEIISAFDPTYVQAAWQKALDRRSRDPEGAITAAKSLLESVCKHVLDDTGVEYASDLDLPKLWALTSEKLNLAPNQHQEAIFRAILGNCQSVVNNLGAIRNRVGDAHGQGRRQVKPAPRHAELAVNLAGTMASFLIATWQARDRPD